MLQFLCPNGHRIHCPDDQAGRAAKCPKCGSAFKVPTADQLGDSDGPVSAESESGVTKAGAGSGPGRIEVRVMFPKSPIQIARMSLC